VVVRDTSQARIGQTKNALTSGICVHETQNSTALQEGEALFFVEPKYDSRIGAAMTAMPN
jgi:hypothetical protein